MEIFLMELGNCSGITKEFCFRKILVLVLQKLELCRIGASQSCWTDLHVYIYIYI